MPVEQIAQMQQNLANMEAEQRVALNQIETLENELRDMGIDPEDLEAALDEVEQNIRNSQRKRNKYLAKATAIIERYDTTRS